MGFSINSFKTGITSLFSRKVKQAEPEVKRVVHKTDIMTNPVTGVTKFERMYTDANGKSCFFTVETETLADGTKKTKTKVQSLDPEGKRYTHDNEGVCKNRVKTVKREKGGSILGGDKVTIEKDYQETMGETAHKEIMTKDFDKKGHLQHKEYSIKYRHWDRAKTGVQDRVYEEYPLPHSASDIKDVAPTEHTRYKHSYDGHNNYHHFTDRDETMYSMAVKAQEQARINAAKAAEEAKIAAEKAKAEYEATLPKINTGKMFGKDISEFERTEKTLEDGTIERVYTEIGKDKPSIITRDRDNVHQEWIHGGKTEFLYAKQVGDRHPYIIAKKGGYTQQVKPNSSGATIDTQYRYDGIRSYEGGEYGGKLRMPYNETKKYKEASADSKAMYDRWASAGKDSKIWCQSTASRDTRGAEVVEEYKNATENRVDLLDLFEPYTDEVKK